MVPTAGQWVNRARSASEGASRSQAWIQDRVRRSVIGREAGGRHQATALIGKLQR
jgi:hypothetical protein